MGVLCPSGNTKSVNNSTGTAQTQKKQQKGRKPSFDIEGLKRLHLLGYTDGEIAKKLQSKRTTITMARGRLGLPPNRKIIEDELRKLIREGFSDTKIAEVLGCTQQGVTAARNRLQIKANYLIGQHGAVTVDSNSYLDKDKIWLDEQQRLHAIEMSKNSRISNSDLLNWVASGYKLGGRNNTTYIYNDHNGEKPQDMPDRIRAVVAIDPGGRVSSDNRKGKGGGQQSTSNSIAFSGLLRT